MVMSWIFLVILLISTLCAAFTGQGSALSAAVAQGAQAGITLAVSMAGAICLWTGVGALLESAGFMGVLRRLLKPVLEFLFPGTKSDPALASCLSGNICANILGLGNAATPMGIQAARRMADPDRPAMATDQLCRLIVLNTASIQLIPATVAGVRASLGCTSPFDLLPAVWLTSICSAGMGVSAAFFLGRLWKND